MHEGRPGSRGTRTQTSAESSDAEDPKADGSVALDMLSLLQFKSKLAHSADVYETLELAAAILESVWPGVQAAFAQAHRNSFASEKQLARAEIDLDMSVVLWDRYMYKHGFSATEAQLIDASEFKRESYLCTRTDQLCLPQATHAVDRQTMDKQYCSGLKADAADSEIWS